MMALRLGICKSTARRYLDSAVEAGEIIAYLEHGNLGGGQASIVALV